MRKINFIFQEFLKFFLIFLLTFVWIRYFIHKLLLATLISLIVTTILYIILYFLTRKRKNKENLKIKEKEEAENIFLTLACNSKRADFFYKLASKKHENIKKFKDYLIINHEDGTKTLLYYDLNFNTLNIPTFIEIYNKIKHKAEKAVILCYAYDKQVKTFANNFDMKFLIFDRFETYQRLYKFYDTYPEIKEKYKKDKLLTFKDFVAYSFNKKRAKGYLISALLLVLSALFVRTTIYYCITATILIVFAIISQFNHIFNFKEPEEVL